MATQRNPVSKKTKKKIRKTFNLKLWLPKTHTYTCKHMNMYIHTTHKHTHMKKENQQILKFPFTSLRASTT